MKKIFALCLVSFTLSACVMNEELDSVIQEQETPTIRVSNVQNQEARSIPESEFARLVVDFKNQTTDLLIKVQSIQLCNIHQSGTYLFPTTSNEGYTTIAIPFSIHLRKGKVHTLEIVLEHGCSWYDISGSIPSPILKPITFGGSVEEWVDVS